MLFPGLCPCPQSAVAGEPLPGAVVRPAMLCQLLVLAWRLRGLGASEDAEEPTAAGSAAADLADKRATLMEQLAAIAAASDSAAVKDEVCGGSAAGAGRFRAPLACTLHWSLPGPPPTLSA